MRKFLQISEFKSAIKKVAPYSVRETHIFFVFMASCLWPESTFPYQWETFSVNLEVKGRVQRSYLVPVPLQGFCESV